MELFKPKGAIPEWRKVYDVLATKAVDDVLTYNELAEILGRDFDDDRAPMYRATKELLVVHKRGTVNERGVGYRIARPNEHAGLVVKQRSRARRAINKGVKIIEGTDRSKLTPSERKRLDDLEVNVRAQADMLRRTEARVSRLEKAEKYRDDKLDLLIADLRRKGIDVDLPDPVEEGPES